MALTTRAMPDDPSLQAAMYGPIVLAGRLGTQGLTPEMTYGGYDCELSGKPLEVDDIAGSWTDPASWLEASPGRPLAFRTKGQARPIDLVPLNRLFDEHYAVYWKIREASAQAVSERLANPPLVALCERSVP